jgi:hypothetical protein
LFLFSFGFFYCIFYVLSYGRQARQAVWLVGWIVPVGLFVLLAW